jgi:hypothetical protein
MLSHPTKGFWELTQYSHHLGIDIDTATCYFFAPTAKLQKLAKQARQLMQRPTRASKWLPVKELQISRVIRNNFFSLPLLPDSPSASCTPYLATSRVDESASPVNSVATYSGGHMFPVTQTERTSTAQSRQPTYTATARGLVGERY